MLRVHEELRMAAFVTQVLEVGPTGAICAWAATGLATSNARTSRITSEATDFHQETILCERMS